MVKIYLCDDEKLVYETVISMLKHYQSIEKILLELTWFSSGEELLKNGDYCDILLLDIEMPKMDGIETAEKWIKADMKCSIIMLTGNIQRFKEAFRIGAFRYVTKPIEEEELFEAITDARRRLIGHREMEIMNRGITYSLLEKDIIYLMAERNVTLVCTKFKEYRSQISIQKWMEKLNPNLFYQCHRSFIVNLSYVEKITETEAKMKSGERIKVSRRKYSDFIRHSVAYETKYR